MTEWHKITDVYPEHGRDIFIWDACNQKEFMITFMSEPSRWSNGRGNVKFPYWRYVQEKDEEDIIQRMPFPKPPAEAAS